jgi:hypothetical protein
VRSSLLAVALFLAAHAVPGLAGADSSNRSNDSDRWLTNAPPLPTSHGEARVDANLFRPLRAEVLTERFRIVLPGATWRDPRIVASAEAPGHWPARDWQTFPMKRDGAGWAVELPVERLDVPWIYFAVTGTGSNAVGSPLRIASPRGLGLEQPTRFFWPFVEGFEQGTESWRAAEEGTLAVAPLPRTGRAAARVKIPEGRHAATVTTTRLRGWQLEERGARGVSVALRTRAGRGTARFALHENAFSPQHVVAQRRESVSVSTNWAETRLLFTSFPKFTLGEVDLFSIELSGEPGTEFFIDDLQLLGPWRMEF